MLNSALFKMEWKQNYKILLIFGLILSMYISIMISMFDPELGTALDEFTKTMPELMSLIGMNGSTATLVSFLSTYLYGLLMIVFPLIFTIMLAMRLLARKVENGFMAYLLSSGVERKTVWSTQLFVLLSSLFVLIVYCTILGIVLSSIMFPGELDILAFVQLNFGVLCLHVCFASIAYLCSSVCNETRTATMIGAGLPVVFILIQMLSNMKGDLERLKYGTILTLFDTEGLIASEMSAFAMLGVLIIISIICFTAAQVLFKKRNLPL